MPGGNSVREVLHDLRAPLAVIRSQCDELGAGMPAEEIAELRQIRRSAELMSQRIDELLAPGGSSRTSTPEAVDLAECAAAVTELLRPLARARGIALVLDARAQAPVLGDRVELESAVQNLLDNAMRYAPRSSEVRCKVRGFAGRVRVVVEDHGPGIAEADRARVLGVGARGPGGQSGLGLSVVARVVECHGGVMTLQDARGGGLRVTLDLPASRVHTQATRKPRRRSPDGARTGAARAARPGTSVA